jgi:cysteinyl-tRNA synthetase, unknown class
MSQYANPSSQVRTMFARVVLLWLWIIVLPAAAYADDPPTLDSVPALDTVKVWDYQLRRLDIAVAATKPSDMIVIEAGIGGDGTGVSTTEQIEHLRIKPDGTRRLVIAYLSIGEAESYRPYWKPEWHLDPPDWLIGENCRWPKNFPVRYWMPAWQEIMIGPSSETGAASETVVASESDMATDTPASSALSRIIDLGFDGVYLDRVDVFQDVVEIGEQTDVNARESMIAFVRDLSARAKARKPEFHVIIQNAEELLATAAYRRAIDAVAKEDLLHGLKGTGIRNNPGDIQASRDLLRRLKRDNKPVFVIEYLTTENAIANTAAELAREKFTPVFPTRGLDGEDPIIGAAELAGQFGTPEYGAANCTGLLKSPPSAAR